MKGIILSGGRPFPSTMAVSKQLLWFLINDDILSAVDFNAGRY